VVWLEVSSMQRHCYPQTLCYAAHLSVCAAQVLPPDTLPLECQCVLCLLSQHFAKPSLSPCCVLQCICINTAQVLPPDVMLLAPAMRCCAPVHADHTAHSHQLLCYPCVFDAGAAHVLPPDVMMLAERQLALVFHKFLAHAPSLEEISMLCPASAPTLHRCCRLT
jgi:hypothetical protein